MENSNESQQVSVITIADTLVLGRDSQRVEWEVEKQIKDGVRKFILDMSKTVYIDSAGIGILVGCLGKVKEAGGHSRVAGATGRTMQIIELTQVAKILNLSPTVEEARAALEASE